MGSINKSHNEADGGILLFNGELILLYCDSVQCEVGGKESVKGRVYLTTHRLVMIVTPYRQNLPVKSLCAPFCAITKCNVEQPIFGANYIEATVRDENDGTKSFSFKLRFSKGGAIEFAMAMNRAVLAVGRNFNPSMPPPPAYTPAPSAQYYQAPPTVYAPGYNSGIQMPLQQFPDQPPIGFIYASSAPPPYPGLGGQGQQASQPPPPYSQPGQQQQQPSTGYPGSAGNPNQQSGYPSSQGYPGQQQQGYYPQPAAQGYPQQPPANYPQAQPSTGYPPSSSYAPQPGSYPGPQAQSGYPNQQASAGYPNPQASGGYPAPQSQGGYPVPQAGSYSQQPGAPSNPSYPDLSQQSSGYPSEHQSANQPPAAGWPTAPSFNPNWQEEKKS